MTRLGFLTALALCGCTSFAGAPERGDSPLVAECRREARNSPGVNDANRQFNWQNRDNVDRVRREVEAAEQRVFNACLRREGLPLPGGVEQVQRRGYGF